MKTILTLLLISALFSIYASEDFLTAVKSNLSVATGITKPDFRAKPTRNELANFVDQDWHSRKKQVLLALAEVVTGCDDVLIGEIKGEQNNLGIVKIVTAVAPNGVWIERSAVQPLMPDSSGSPRYLVGAYAPDGNILSEAMVKKYRYLWSYLLRNKQRLESRKNFQVWYGVAEYRVISNWISLDDVLQLKPNQADGVFMFVGGAVVLDSVCRFTDRQESLQSVNFPMQFAGASTGRTFIFDLASIQRGSVTVERLFAEYSIIRADNPDYDKYWMDLAEAAQRLLLDMSKSVKAENMEEQFLVALANVIGISMTE